MTNQSNIPVSFHRGESALPFVPYQEGVTFQLLQVDINNSLWAIRGANLDLDDEDNVISVLDAATILDIYRAQCAEMGINNPEVIGA